MESKIIVTHSNREKNSSYQKLGYGVKREIGRKGGRRGGREEKVGRHMSRWLPGARGTRNGSC